MHRLPLAQKFLLVLVPDLFELIIAFLAVVIIDVNDLCKISVRHRVHYFGQKFFIFTGHHDLKEFPPPTHSQLGAQPGNRIGLVKAYFQLDEFRITEGGAEDRARLDHRHGMSLDRTEIRFVLARTEDDFWIIRGNE